MTFRDAADASALDVAELVARKQKDYGPGNILNCPVGVELGIAVRLNDKIERLVHLIQSGQTPSNESLLDTASDIMGYGLVLKMYLDGSFTYPLDEHV